MANEERKITERLKRRLASARASVVLEFAFVAPLVFAMAVFAADMTRILRTEQQLEIASRLAADVEAHMADYYAKDETPCTKTKVVGKYYLVEVAQVADKVGSVYMKGGCEPVKNLVTFAVDWVKKFLDGTAFGEDNVFWKLVGKIFGGLINFLSFRTFNYIIDIIPHDREVRISTAVYIPTILPIEAYSAWTLPERSSGKIGIAQFAPDLEGGAAEWAGSMKLNTSKRHRVYCYMPVIDSVPIAPETYVRKFKSWCAKQPFLKGLVD